MKKVLFLLLSITILMCLVACKQEQQQEPTPEHTHSFGEWSVTKNATCTEDGVKTRFCDCGEMETENMASIGHNYFEGICTLCNGSDPSYVNEEYIPSEGLEYVLLDNGAYEVKGIGSCKDDVIVIPSIYEGKPVESIGEYAFDNCYYFSKVVIPESITSISSKAFLVCLSLEKIIVDENNTVFKSVDGNLYTKDGKTILQYAIGKRDHSFIIPNDVTTIGRYAFGYCYRLSSITISESVTLIEDEAFIFDSYSRLVEVINKSGLNIIAGDDNHGSVAVNSFEVHSGDTKIVNKNNFIFYSYNGKNYLVNYVGNEQKIVLPESYEGQRYEINCAAFSMELDLIDVTISSGVTKIGAGAFWDCENMINVKFEEGVNYIEEAAFMYCESIVCIEIPNTVISIGDSAFEDCRALENVVISDSVINVGCEMFKNCQSLINIVIGNGVTTIPNSFLSDCSSLVTVSIGNGVTSIEDYVLFFCLSLTDIQYAGTVEQWNSIRKELNWDYVAAYDTIYCIDGEIAKDGTVTYYK